MRALSEARNQVRQQNNATNEKSGLFVWSIVGFMVDKNSNSTQDLQIFRDYPTKSEEVQPIVKQSKSRWVNNAPILAAPLLRDSHLECRVPTGAGHRNLRHRSHGNHSSDAHVVLTLGDAAPIGFHSISSRDASNVTPACVFVDMCK